MNWVMDYYLKLSFANTIYYFKAIIAGETLKTKKLE
jgi:hypothetical protein